MPKRKPKPEPAAPATVLTAPATEPAAGPAPERVEQVLKWILSGARDFDIADAIKQTWPEQSQAEILTAAVNYFRETANIDPQIVRGFCFDALKTLYEKQLAIGDFAGATSAIRTILKEFS